MIVGLYLNLDRSELRQASRTAVGIREAFSEVNSEAMLSAVLIDPVKAMFERERQQALAELNARESRMNGSPAE